MLRDYEFQRVIFISDNWELEFYLDKIPSYALPKEEKDKQKEIRGLFARLSFLNERYLGNAVKLITANEENLETLQKARDLFYHSENTDFQNPDITNNTVIQKD